MQRKQDAVFCHNPLVSSNSFRHNVYYFKVCYAGLSPLKMTYYYRIASHFGQSQTYYPYVLLVLLGEWCYFQR